MAERLRKEALPPPWSYGVTKDGRIFFINDQTRRTTWIHPVRGVPIGTGYTNREDLPPGWQESVTPEGAVYFIDHNEKQTSFHHPFTGRTEVESNDLLLVEPERLIPSSADQTMSSKPSSDFNVMAKVKSPRSSSQNNVSSPTTPSSPSVGGKPSFKSRKVPKAATPTPRRGPNSTITMEGWLYKQDSGGLKLWKRRWCVISDFCLFYYKGADEVTKAGSLMLPSYQITHCTQKDKVNRKYAFKCEHENMRTYLFAAENQGQMNQWLSAFQMASMVRMDKSIGPPQNGDTNSMRDDDDAGFGEYRSRPRHTPTRSATLPNMTSPNSRLKSPRDDPNPTHQQNGRQRQPSFDDPRYSAPPKSRGRDDSISSRDSYNPDGYWPPNGRHQQNKPPSPAKRKLYNDYSSPDEGSGSRYDPTLDPFADENVDITSPPDWSQIKGSIDGDSVSSDEDGFSKRNAPASSRNKQPEKETLTKTKAQEDHAGYVTRKPDPRGQRPKDDYEDMTGLGYDVDQQWSTGSEDDSESETDSYSDEEEEDDNDEDDDEFSPASPQSPSPSHPHHPHHQDVPPLSSSYSLPTRNARAASPRSPSSPVESPPHTPGHYPASYNTLPRRKSRSRTSSTTSKEDGQLSPRPISGEQDDTTAKRPASLHLQRKDSPRDYDEVRRSRRGSDPNDPSYHSRQPSSPETQPYTRSSQDVSRGTRSPPSSQRVSSPSSASSGSRGERPTTHGTNDRFRGPDKPPRDQNENNVFHYPTQPATQQREPTSPEQRSFLQSPLILPSKPVTPEQRIDINSPMTFQGKPQWPHKHKESNQQSPSQSSTENGFERITPSIQEPVKSSAPTQEAAPPSGHYRELSVDLPSRSQSKEMLAEPQDQADIAPTRINKKASPNLRKRDTLERQEIEAGDQFPAALDNEGSKMGAQPTSRFRKWQQKIQPYITLSTGIRLRLSIAGDELLGKSHEELVLLLIQLRRDQANLQCWLEMLDDELSLLRDPDSLQGSPSRGRKRPMDQLRLSNPDLTEDQRYYKELEKERDEVETELEISRPLINLVDNLVRMGSLYGGQNELIAQEFYKDKAGLDAAFPPPKKLIEFSRKREEELLQRDLEDEWNQVQTAADRQLEEKLSQLHKQDRTLQEISTNVSLLKEEKDKIESSMERLQREMRRSWEDSDRMKSLEEQQQDLKKELVKVRTLLAKGTKKLEEITSENAKIEHEVAVLKSKLQSDKQSIPDPSSTAGGTKEKLQIEREVSRVQSLLSNLDQQRELLSSQMQGIRNSGDVSVDKGPPDVPPDDYGHYYSTDLDTMETTDMSPSYLRSRTNTQTKLARSPEVTRPLGRQDVVSKNAISDRVNVAPSRGNDSGGRPSSASRNSWTPQDGRQSLPRDSTPGNYSNGRGQNGYHHSPLVSRRADETHASPPTMDYRGGSHSQPRRNVDLNQSPLQHSPSQHRRFVDNSRSPAQQRRSMDNRLSPAQHRRNVDPRLSPAQHGQTQYSPGQHRHNGDLRSSPAQRGQPQYSPAQHRRNGDSRLSPAQHGQSQYSPAQQRRREYQYGSPGFHRDHDVSPMNSRSDSAQPNYMNIGPSDKYRDEHDPRGRSNSYNRPMDPSSSMPRNQARHTDSMNSHATHPSTAQRSNTLPNPSTKPYVVTDLDTKQSQQISPELYDDRDPPSGSSSSQKSAEPSADEYFVTPETRTGESQGNPSYGGPYSTLPGGLEGRDYDSQPGHDRYKEPPRYDARSQSLPQPHRGGQRSSKPYTVTDLDTKKSSDISETDLGRFVGSGNNNNSNRQVPAPQRRSDSLGRVKEMQGSASPYQSHQDYPQHSSPSQNHSQPPPPDIVSSPIQDGIYFATPSPRHSLSEEVTESGVRPLDRWLENGAGIPTNSTKTMDASLPRSKSMPNQNEKLIDGEEIIPTSHSMDYHQPPPPPPPASSSHYYGGDGLNSEGHAPWSDSDREEDEPWEDFPPPPQFLLETPQSLPNLPQQSLQRQSPPHQANLSLPAVLVNGDVPGRDAKHKRHASLDGHVSPLHYQRLEGDLDIYDLEKVLKTQEEEEEEDDVSRLRGSETVHGGADYKAVEFDETSGRGLHHRNSEPLTYQQAKRRWLREKFFAYDSQLGMPAKILIPERYNPLDESEDETGLSPEERVQKERRVENIQKMLSSHSMPEWGTTESEVNENQQEYLKRKVAEEKVMRQEVLAMRRELAAEVRQQTRVIAAKSMRQSGHEQ